MNLLLTLVAVSVINMSGSFPERNAHHIKGEEYNLSKPSETYLLPPVLKEISGITCIDNSTIACIQDEDGFFFIYNLRSKTITFRKSFHSPGDYEGITQSGKSLFILRSDGTIFEIVDYLSPGAVVNRHATGIPANDFEGLCYDNENKRLLIAPKGKIRAEINKSKRMIYAFDIATKKTGTEPVMVFDINDTRKFASENNPELIRKTKEGKEKLEDINFETSAIAVHPVSGRLYLISSTDRLLFIISSSGNIEEIHKLSKKLFPQPEGISFLPDGDMLISNEGSDGSATILRFSSSD